MKAMKYEGDIDMTTLSAQEMPLHKVFSDDYLFTIPAVQRPYSWTIDQAGELLDDLLQFIEESNITINNVSQKQEPYFLGSVVLIKHDRPDAEVLDGQQRLTTLTILLAVLRDVLGGEYAANIEAMILQKGNKILNKSDMYRLHLRDIDNEFFKINIQMSGATSKLNYETTVKTDSQQAIRDNALFYMEKLNTLEQETIQILPSVIATLCYLVIVCTPNFDSAFRIFTVLNDRGLDLMMSDIFKAKVIGKIEDKDRERYTQKWEDIEISLGRDHFNKLFDHIRMIIQKRKGTANYKDEYQEILSKIHECEFIDDFLIPYGEIFQKITNYRAYYNNPELVKILALLNRIDNSDWIPPTMYYMKNYSYDDIGLSKFLARVEIVAGTGMILRKNFNWRMTKYSSILKEMEQGKDLFSYESAMEVMDSDKKEVLDKLQGNVYSELKDTARRYILLRLDSLLTNGQPYYDHSLITVEHVLPQTPKPDSEWLKHFKQPEKFVHKLGNLVLLTRAKNSQARNYEFIKKKNSYFQSNNGVSSFALTTQVIKETEWTPEILVSREEKLLQLLKRAWNLNISNSLSEVKNDLKDSNMFFYIQSNRGADAKGVLVETGFKVLQGSYFAIDMSESVQNAYIEIRNELIAETILFLEEDKLKLKEDYVFSSPSTAASLILGRSANGLIEWKTLEGILLKELML